MATESVISFDGYDRPRADGEVLIAHDIPDCIVINFTFSVNGSRVGAGSVSAPPADG